MDCVALTSVPAAPDDGRRPEPRWMTLADLAVIVAGVALVMAIPSRSSGWPPFLPPPAIVYVAVMGCRGLIVNISLVLALVVLFRRGRYGGLVRPAEWLLLGLAATPFKVLIFEI